MKKKSISLLIFMLFLPGLIFSQGKGPKTINMNDELYEEIYFVSSIGSDESGTGTKSKPWATPAYAIERVMNKLTKNNAAIKIAEGNYNVTNLDLPGNILFIPRNIEYELKVSNEEMLHLCQSALTN